MALLIAAVGGGAVVVWRAVRDAAADPSEGSLELRRVRLAEAGTSAGLVALVAVLSGGLSFGAVVGLVSLAVTAGRAVRAAMTCQVLMPGQGGLAVAYFALAVVSAGAVLVVGVVARGGSSAGVAVQRPDPAVLARDSIRFAVPVQHHERPPVVTVSHRPTVADAHYGGGIAVPVERWALDGTTLVLQVAHHSACYIGVVVIGPAAGTDTAADDGADDDGADDGGAVEVIVLYGRIFLLPPTTSAPPDPDRPDPNGCRPTGDVRLTDHSTVEISLPTGQTVTTVRDTGATGPALHVP